MDASLLFRPIRVGALGLKNRMIMPAMGTAYANADGTVSDRMVRFLNRRAQGGVALVVMELAAVDPHPPRRVDRGRHRSPRPHDG